MMIVIMMMIASYTNDYDRYPDYHQIMFVMMMMMIMTIASYTNNDDGHHDDDRIVHG